VRTLFRVAAMSALGRAWVDALDDDDLRELARRLAPFLPAAPTSDGWMTTRQAAEYLGVSVAAMHRLTASRALRFEQDGPGCRCWFRRADLDAYRSRRSSIRAR
jgi:excisionase family DNA binding protein